MFFGHILEKGKCSRKGCGREGIYIPHLFIKPPNDIKGPSLSVPLSIVVCNEHKKEMEKMGIIELIPEDAWGALNEQIYIQEVPEGEDSILPANTTLMFHTQDEFIALFDRGTEQIH